MPSAVWKENVRSVPGGTGRETETAKSSVAPDPSSTTASATESTSGASSSPLCCSAMFGSSSSLLCCSASGSSSSTLSVRLSAQYMPPPHQALPAVSRIGTPPAPRRTSRLTDSAPPTARESVSTTSLPAMRTAATERRPRARTLKPETGGADVGSSASSKGSVNWSPSTTNRSSSTRGASVSGVVLLTSTLVNATSASLSLAKRTGVAAGSWWLRPGSVRVGSWVRRTASPCRTVWSSFSVTLKSVTSTAVTPGDSVASRPLLSTVRTLTVKCFGEGFEVVSIRLEKVILSVSPSTRMPVYGFPSGSGFAGSSAMAPLDGQGSLRRASALPSRSVKRTSTRTRAPTSLLVRV